MSSSAHPDALSVEILVPRAFGLNCFVVAVIVNQGAIFVSRANAVLDPDLRLPYLIDTFPSFCLHFCTLYASPPPLPDKPFLTSGPLSLVLELCSVDSTRLINTPTPGSKLTLSKLQGQCLVMHFRVLRALFLDRRDLIACLASLHLILLLSPSFPHAPLSDTLCPSRILKTSGRWQVRVRVLDAHDTRASRVPP